MIRDAAESLRLVEIDYLKPGEVLFTTRRIEPYQFHSSGSNLMVLSWQIHPEILEPVKWRHFRLDRILSLRLLDLTFSPRTDVTIPLGTVHDFQFGLTPVRWDGPAGDYLKFVERVIWNVRLGAEDRKQSKAFQEIVDRYEMASIHCAVLAAVLKEVMDDGVVTPADVERLRGVMRMLKSLGWKPGDDLL